jgi:hypothetical protein
MRAVQEERQEKGHCPEYKHLRAERQPFIAFGTSSSSKKIVSAKKKKYAGREADHEEAPENSHHA